MYKVLYRKWRPQTFDDVVGQPHITSTLSNEVRENRLAHAYLFTGSRGTGKTSCAKILSKAINCLNPIDGNPCCECEICKGIDSGAIMDVTEIDAASNRGIEDIKAIRDESAFAPAKAKYRVYIIDEVHMLTIEAFNALLKTLEEPPVYVKFILATTEVQKLPSTILSRCQRFDFRRISSEDIADRLKYVCKNEGVSITEDAAMLIARISDGGMRDALSLLDRCIGISDNIDGSVVTDAAGIMSYSYLKRMAVAFSERNSSSALSIIDELHKSSCDSERLLTELTNYFRNILMIKTVKEPEKLIICTDEEMNDLKDISTRFRPDEIFFILDVLTQTTSNVKKTQNKRIEAEIAVIKICSPISSNDITALTSRIAFLEKELEKVKSEGITVKQNADVIQQKQENENVNDILADIPFDEDDEVPFDFDEPNTTDNAELPFDEAPFGDDMPFDDSMVPPENDNAVPFVEDEKPKKKEPVSDDLKIWEKIIIETEKSCPPLIGQLIGSKVTISGNVITVVKYNDFLPKLFETKEFVQKIEFAAKRITGKEYSIRLDNSK